VTAYALQVDRDCLLDIFKTLLAYSFKYGRKGDIRNVRIVEEGEIN
jgi:hypothetical protein